MKVSLLATTTLKPVLPAVGIVPLTQHLLCATAIPRITMVTFFTVFDTMAGKGQDPAAFGSGYVHRKSLP